MGGGGLGVVLLAGGGRGRGLGVGGSLSQGRGMSVYVLDKREKRQQSKLNKNSVSSNLCFGIIFISFRLAKL